MKPTNFKGETMKRRVFVLLLIAIISTGCATATPTLAPQPTAVPPTAAPATVAPSATNVPATSTPSVDARTQQFQKLQTLLRDQSFALEMAQYLDAAYYKGINQPVPPFLKPEEETATQPKSVKEEKIAINLAGFYALEVGISAISDRTKETPIEILDSITKGTRSKEDMLLLGRFANATWKAGQPFRALSRITRDTFKPSTLLSNDDVQKDLDQIKAAAEKVSEKMQDVRGKDRNEQFLKLQTLLRDPVFALEIAQYIDAAYYKGINQPVQPFLKPEEETATQPKSVKEEKISINLAGFYALEVGISAISDRTKETPNEIIDSVVKGTRSKEDMQLLGRFANATWKAGQPFRSLSRITRDTFKPSTLLSNDDVQKDLDQVNAAAQKLQDAMKK